MYEHNSKNLINVSLKSTKDKQNSNNSTSNDFTQLPRYYAHLFEYLPSYMT